ncbi:hypothetical protein D3C73_1177550 [compost metagenome]
MIGEVTPVKQHRHTGDFPVTRRRVFAGREFMRPCVGTDHFRITVHSGGNFTCRTFVSFHQAQTGQVRQIQRTFATIVSFAFRTGFCNMPHSIGANVAKAVSVFSRTYTKGVQHHNKCTFHIILRTFCAAKKRSDQYTVIRLYDDRLSV